MRTKVVISVVLILGMIIYPIRPEAAIEKVEAQSISENSVENENNAVSSNMSEYEVDGLSENQVSLSENQLKGEFEKTVSCNDEFAESKGKEKKTVECLQIPQKLNVTIDALEIDGRGQIYSDKYEIRNIGRMAGTLRIHSFTCGSWKNNQLVVREDKEGLHDGEEQSIYIEVVFEGKDKIVLTEEPSEYKVELGPEEGLSLYFTGEVNENAPVSWGEQGIEIRALYSWEAEKEKAITEGVSENKAQGKDLTVSSDQPVLSENAIEMGEGGIQIDEEEGQGTEDDIDKKAKRIDLSQELQEISLSANFWEPDEAGRIKSLQYILKNDGKTGGNLSALVSDSTDGIEEQSMVSENRVDYLSADQAELFHLKIVSERGDEIALSTDSSEHKIRLEPGEETVVWFIVETDEQILKSLQNEDFTVTVSFVWCTESTMQENKERFISDEEGEGDDRTGSDTK